MKTKQRIIIIGGSGFIGSGLIDRLKDNNKYKIIVIDKNKYKDKRIESYVGDYSNNNLLNKIIKKNDIIFHLAGASVPAKAETNISKEINNDVIKTIKLLEICGNKQIKRFIFISSGGMVYGKYFKPVSEKDITDPISFHGIIKLMIEKYVRLLSHRYNFSYIILRPANLYGRLENYDRPQGAVDIFLRKAIKKETIEIWGNGSMIRDYIFIDDVINFLEKLLKSNIKNEVINLGTGKSASLIDIINIIENILGHEIHVKYLSARNFDLKYNVLNITRARKLLKWQPKYQLNQCIKKLYKEINY